MPNDKAYKEATKRGIKRVVTVQPKKGYYMHVYIVKRAGPRGGHSVQGNLQKKRGYQ